MQGKTQPLICRGFSRPITHIEHSGLVDGEDFYIVAACLDGSPQICDGRTGDWVGTLKGHKGAVWCSRFNTDATLVATASADYTAKLWDAVTGEEKANYAHKGMLKSVTFASDSSVIATGGLERVLRLYDVERPEAPVFEKADSHPTTIKSVMYNKAYQNTLCTACEDNVVRSWDMRSGELVASTELKGVSELLSLKVSPDGRFLITTAGKKVVFWTAERLEPILSFDTDLHQANTAALNPAADRFVVGCEDFDVYRFDIQGTQLDSHRGHHGPCTAVSYAPDGKTFASGAGDGTVRIWLDEVEEYGLWEMTKPSGGSSIANSPSSPSSESPAPVQKEEKVEKVEEEKVEEKAAAASEEPEAEATAAPTVAPEEEVAPASDAASEPEASAAPVTAEASDEKE